MGTVEHAHVLVLAAEHVGAAAASRGRPRPAALPGRHARVTHTRQARPPQIGLTPSLEFGRGVHDSGDYRGLVRAQGAESAQQPRISRPEPMIDGRAREWLDAGELLRVGAQRSPCATVEALQIFHAEFGDPDAPPLLLLHGFPTSSIDWYDVVGALSQEHRVCVLDFPGFGFSDKPKGESYTLGRDCELVEHYLGEVLGARAGAVVAHDRGDSVALTFAARCASGETAFELSHLVLSNGNMFLPLSNLNPFQRLVLDPGLRAGRARGGDARDCSPPGWARTRSPRPRSAGRPGHRRPRADLRLQRRRRGAPRHDPVPRRALQERAGLEALARSPVRRPSSGASTTSSRRCGWRRTSGTPTWPPSRATTSSGFFSQCCV